MRIGDLSIREKASEGVKVPLVWVDGTEIEGQWLLIRSIYADEYRRVKLHWDRKLSLLRATKEPAESLAEEHHAQMLKDHAAALVAGWSLDDECTKENIEKLLEDCPPLIDQIIETGDKTALFFSKPPQTS
jgi:hypothetical protein